MSILWCTVRKTSNPVSNIFLQLPQMWKLCKTSTLCSHTAPNKRVQMVKAKKCCSVWTRLKDWVGILYTVKYYFILY